MWLRHSSEKLEFFLLKYGWKRKIVENDNLVSLKLQLITSNAAQWDISVKNCQIDSNLLNSANLAKLSPSKITEKHTTKHTHTIHVWYIYLNLVDFNGTCRNIYHTLMIWDTCHQK